MWVVARATYGRGSLCRGIGEGKAISGAGSREQGAGPSSPPQEGMGGACSPLPAPRSSFRR